MAFDRHSNLKYKFGNRHFWADGYYVSTVGLNTETVRKYIREQEMAVFGQDTLEKKIVRIPEENRQEEKLKTT